MIKRLISALSMLAAIAFIVPLAHATSTVSSGTVISIGLQPGTNYAIVAVTNATGAAPPNNPPTNPCAPIGNYSIDITTAQGKAILSVLEGAQLGGKKVGIGGSANNACTGGAEVLGIVTVFTN
jgi:hypothetical protein